MREILRHPMLHEPVVFPRVVVAVLGAVAAVFGIEVTVVDTADPGSLAEAIASATQVVVPVLLAAWVGQGYTPRARTDSPATITRHVEQATIDLTSH